MRKLIMLFFLLSSVIFSQKIGSTLTPYSTFGWDTPFGYTQYYGLPVYKLLSNPGGWINQSQFKVDSLLHALVVYTDTTEMTIKNDTLRLNYKIDGGIAYFDTASSTKDIMLSDMESTDIVTVSLLGTISDALTIVYYSDKFTVRRYVTNGGQGFTWIRIKK